MTTILDGLRKEFVVYRSDEFPRLLHALKTALAVAVSMLICMRLELRAPGTAMLSAAVVMVSQRSGMAIARGFYRALGMVAGSFAGITLVSLFAQQPVLFLAGLSLWIGVFVAGSSYYKNAQSYGFVLSGYAACVATLPEWPTPYDAIYNVIERLSEIAIGVGTGGLVSALVLPQKVVPALMKWRETALSSLLPALRAAAREDDENQAVEGCLSLIQQSVSIEELRTAAVFEEPEMRLRNDALVELDRRFLDTTTRVFAIYRARKLAMSADGEARSNANEILEKLVGVAQDDSADSSTEQRVEKLYMQLCTLEEAWPAYMEREVCTGQCDDAHSRTIEMVGAEVYSAVVSLREFCSACMMVFDPPTLRFTQPIARAITFMRSAPIRSSGVTAVASGLRAAAAIGVVGGAWIISGWNDGFSAVVSAAITSGLFSLNPTPVPGSWQAFTGCLLAWMTAFVMNFFLMPVFGDVTLLALSVGLTTCLGGYVTTFPKWLSLGSGFNIYFCYILTPTNVAVYDPPFILDRGFALLVGIAVSAVAFSLVVPGEGVWLARRYAARIRELQSDAAGGRIDSADSVQLGRTMRDLIVRIVTVPGVSKARRDRTAEWAFGQFLIANTLMQVRTLALTDALLLPHAWHDAQREWLDAMERVAQRASDSTIGQALAALDRCLSILRTQVQQPWGDEARASFEMGARLSSARAALTDELPVASTAGAVAP